MEFLHPNGEAAAPRAYLRERSPPSPKDLWRTEASVRDTPTTVANPELGQSASTDAETCTTQCYIAAQSPRGIYLASGPYAQHAHVLALLAIVKRIVCSHSPQAAEWAWGCFQTRQPKSSPAPGLLESVLGYQFHPRPRNRYTPLTKARFEAFCYEIRLRGFDTVLTYRGPLPLERWRPLGVFDGWDSQPEQFLADLEWFGADLVRTVPLDPTDRVLRRVWTLSRSATFELPGAPVVYGMSEWRLAFMLGRGTLRAQWRPRGTSTWRSPHSWPPYVPSAPLRTLPTVVMELCRQEDLARCYAPGHGEDLLTTDIFYPPQVTEFEGAFTVEAPANEGVSDLAGPAEAALQRWIERARDVGTDRFERLENFRAQGWRRDELIAFYHDVRHLRWPSAYGECPWKTAQAVAAHLPESRTEQPPPDPEWGWLGRVWEELK